MKCEVYIRGYDDPKKTGEGFRSLVNYRGNPPASWLLDTFKAFHEQIADRPASQDARGGKPNGVLFVTLNPPPSESEQEPYFAFIRFRTVAGEASGSREGYEIIAVFAGKKELAIDEGNWLQRYVRLYGNIDWDAIARDRAPEYEIDGKKQPGLRPMMQGYSFGTSADEWFMRVTVAKRSVPPVAEALDYARQNIQKLDIERNIVIGLDSPLSVLKAFSVKGILVTSPDWLWIKTEEPAPKAMAELLITVVPKDRLEVVAYDMLARAFLEFDEIHISSASDAAAYSVKQQRLGDQIDKINRAIRVCHACDIPLDNARKLKEHCVELRSRENPHFEDRHPEPHGIEWTNWNIFYATLIAGALILSCWAVWSFVIHPYFQSTVPSISTGAPASDPGTANSGDNSGNTQPASGDSSTTSGAATGLGIDDPGVSANGEVKNKVEARSQHHKSGTKHAKKPKADDGDN